jgi:hypothetical protein
MEYNLIKWFINFDLEGHLKIYAGFAKVGSRWNLNFNIETDREDVTYISILQIILHNRLNKMEYFLECAPKEKLNFF